MSGLSTARQRGRIAELCRDNRDSRQLRALVLAEIRQVIDFDAYAWLLTDPQTRVGSAPLASVSDLAQLPQLIRLKYATALNRWTTLSPNTCVTLAQAARGVLSQSLLWRELLHGHGVTDIASIVLTDRFGCWGFLDLWRRGGQPERFSPHDQAFLSSLGAELTAALRACQAATFIGTSSLVDRSEGPTVLLLSGALELLDQTPQSDAHLRSLLPTLAAAAPIPAAAYNVAAQLLAVESGVDSQPARARAHLDGTRWLTLRAARLRSQACPDQAMIAVTVEPIRPADRLDLYARTAGLTRRETGLLYHLARGLSTQQLATEMALSVHTVPDHLKAIFTKTHTHNRGTLLARALGAELADPD